MDDALPLPGLDDVRGQRHVGDVEAGVRRTIAELARLDKLGEIDAGRLAVSVALARMMAKKEASGRMSTVSNDARLLIELLDSFTEGEELTGVDDRLAEIMAQWADGADTIESP